MVVRSYPELVWLVGCSFGGWWNVVWNFEKEKRPCQWPSTVHLARERQFRPSGPSCQQTRASETNWCGSSSESLVVVGSWKNARGAAQKIWSTHTKTDRLCLILSLSSSQQQQSERETGCSRHHQKMRPMKFATSHYQKVTSRTNE